MSPEELVKFINAYLSPMTHIVFDEGGTLDKYIGDALMAFWGAPVDQPDHALRACRPALRFLEELEELRRRWRERGPARVRHRRGHQHRPMIVGNMGSDVRFDYTVMGDAVNLASRLEGTNKEYETRIIISEETWTPSRRRPLAPAGSARCGSRASASRCGSTSSAQPGPPTAEEQAEAIQAFEAAVDALRRTPASTRQRRASRPVLAALARGRPARRYLRRSSTAAV